MQKVGQILKNFNPVKDKYVSREFQSYGIYLSEALDDPKHKSLYIKLAKTVHRSVLDEALSFVIDSGAKSKGALFMWKLKQLSVIGSRSSDSSQSVARSTSSKNRKLTDRQTDI